MTYVLIVVTLSVSQSYMRSTEYYPVVTMQSFTTKDGCEKASQAVKAMASRYQVTTHCVQDGK